MTPWNTAIGQQVADQFERAPLRVIGDKSKTPRCFRAASGSYISRKSGVPNAKPGLVRPPQNHRRCPDSVAGARHSSRRLVKGFWISSVRTFSFGSFQWPWLKLS
jgi:hypothetical protein